MVNQTNPVFEEEDEEYEDDEKALFDEYALLDEDEFEDSQALREIRAKYPPGWHIVKMVGFSWRQLCETDEWCSENLHHRYEKFGWRSGCAYMVGVIFEDVKDAIYFKLRWR